MSLPIGAPHNLPDQTRQQGLVSDVQNAQNQTREEEWKRLAEATAVLKKHQAELVQCLRNVESALEQVNTLLSKFSCQAPLEETTDGFVTTFDQNADGAPLKEREKKSLEGLLEELTIGNVSSRQQKNTFGVSAMPNTGFTFGNPAASQVGGLSTATGFMGTAPGPFCQTNASPETLGSTGGVFSHQENVYGPNKPVEADSNSGTRLGNTPPASASMATGFCTPMPPQFGQANMGVEMLGTRTQSTMAPSFGVFGQSNAAGSAGRFGQSDAAGSAGRFGQSNAAGSAGRFGQSNMVGNAGLFGQSNTACGSELQPLHSPFSFQRQTTTTNKTSMGAFSCGPPTASNQTSAITTNGTSTDVFSLGVQPLQGFQPAISNGTGTGGLFYGQPTLSNGPSAGTFSFGAQPFVQPLTTNSSQWPFYAVNGTPYLVPLSSNGTPMYGFVYVQPTTSNGTGTGSLIGQLTTNNASNAGGLIGQPATTNATSTGGLIGQPATNNATSTGHLIG